MGPPMEPALALDVRQLEKLYVLQDEDAPQLVADMARGFLARTPSRLERMRALLAEGNAPVLANEAHGLATSSGMFGLMRVRMGCKALENLARTGSTAGAGELLSQVEWAFGEDRRLLVAQLKLPE